MDIALVSSALETLAYNEGTRLFLINAQEFSLKHFPPAPPDSNILILHVQNMDIATDIQRVLLTVYPHDHFVYEIKNGDKKNKKISEITNGNLSVETCIFIPSLEKGTSFESFAELIGHLRAPNGCPWDKEQTHQTLRKHLLEETYETIAAIDEENTMAIGEELGDLLLQIVLNAQIASENNSFSITNVIKNIHDKIIRRHPHVFGDTKLDGVDAVLANWEKLKEQERGSSSQQMGILDGVPAILPAIAQAQEYQDRAARVGFDWPNIEGVLDKIKEEIEEIKNAESDFETAAEIGDLIFVLVNLARWKHIDAESALRGTNIKFKKRFGYIEDRAREKGRNLSSLSLDEMESLWQEAKKLY